jgi:hypothetical protein
MNKEKNLIYFTMGNKNYIEIAKLCVDSIVKTGYEGDFLFITDEKNQIQNNFNIKNQIYFMETDKTNLMFSSANKLKIYSWEHVNEYDKFIFSDLDILWFIHPDIIFEKIKQSKIYFTQHINPDSIVHSLFGGDLLNENEKQIYQKSKSVNAGFFCFSTNQLSHFHEMEKYLNDNFHKRNVCLEQPYINVYCTKHELIDTSLNEFVTHDGYHATQKIKPIIHFAGGPGNVGFKYDKMKTFLDRVN